VNAEHTPVALTERPVRGDHALKRQAETLIGFTCREMQYGTAWVGRSDDLVLPRANVWDDPTKARLLLREDVKRPLSTDHEIWPTVFDFSFELDGKLGCLFAYDIWVNLAFLRGQLAATELTVREWWLVGITAPQKHCLRGTVWETLPGAIPAEPDSRWDCLGYDVSDQYLVSGVSHCFSDILPDFSDIKMGWGKLLNEHHLFDDIRQAVMYKTFLNKRIPSHAPFLIFGLWRIR